MTQDEIVDLLTLMASFDRRTIGEADVAAWTLAVGDLAYGDAQEAVVMHYREKRDFLMPADIRAAVKVIRAERLSRTPIAAPPRELLDDPQAYIAALKANTAKAAAPPASVRLAVEGTL